MTKQPNARFLQYMRPVVEALKSLGYSGRPKEVVKAIQDTLDLPPDDIERKTKSGQSIFENDVHWCRSYLVKAGMIDASKRGVWTLTSTGKNAVLDDDAIAKIFRQVQSESRPDPVNPPPTITPPVVPDDDEEPDELDYQALAMERLMKLSPSGFEYFCRALLRQAGFENVEVTGGSGDRGIDGRGTLKVNPLFSMKVAFQAKRYKDTVGSGVVRDFRGSVVGRADRGLIITTGRFTRDAEIEATRDGATHIELIDGPAIINLMQEYEFGLKPVSTFELDEELFDNFEVE